MIEHLRQWLPPDFLSLSLFPHLQKDHEKACYSDVGFDMFGPVSSNARKKQGEKERER